MHKRTQFQPILPGSAGKLCIKHELVREKNLVSRR